MEIINKIARTLNLLSATHKRKIYIYAFLRTTLGLLDVAGVALTGILMTLAAGSISSESNSNSNNLSLGSLNLSIPESFGITEVAVLTAATFILKSTLSVIFLKKFTSTLAKSEVSITNRKLVEFFEIDLEEINSISKSDVSFGFIYASGYATTAILTLTVTIISEAFMLLGIAVIFFLVNPVVTVVTFIYFGLLAFALQNIVGKQFQKQGQVFSNSAAKSIEIIDDSLNSMRELKTLKRNLFFSKRFMEHRENLARANANLNFLGALPRYVVETALMIGTLILVFLSFTTGNIQSAAATLGVFLTGGFRIMASMLPLQNALGAIRLSSSQSDKFFELSELISNEREIEMPITFNQKCDGPVEIRLENVDFKYLNDSKTVLKNVNLTLEKGKTIALIGASGSGKSTLADLIAGLTQPEKGSIVYIDSNGKYVDISKIRIGYVPQAPGIIHGTILENINFGDEDLSKSKNLNKILIDSHLYDLVSTLEAGIETDLGANADSLSGGQLQRVGLARALYAQPNILILDEATSALDPDSELAIAETISELKSHVTIIIIAHRLATVQKADVVHLIENGEITASGTFASLVKENNVVARYAEIMNVSNG